MGIEEIAIPLSLEVSPWLADGFSSTVSALSFLSVHTHLVSLCVLRCDPYKCACQIGLEPVTSLEG